MWWAGNRHQVYLAPTEVGYFDAGAPGGDVRWLPCKSAIEGWELAIDELKRLHPTTRRPALHLWLSGSLARPFVLEPVQGLKRLHEATLLAAGVASNLTGLDGPCDVWLGGWRPDTRCLAVAWESRLHSDVETLAREKKVRLTGISPWWVRATDAGIDEAAAVEQMLAIEEKDALTVLVAQGSEFLTASSIAPKPPDEQMVDMLNRLSLSAGVADGDRLRGTLRREGTAGDTGATDPFAFQAAVPQ